MEDSPEFAEAYGKLKRYEKAKKYRKGIRRGALGAGLGLYAAKKSRDWYNEDLVPWVHEKSRPTHFQRNYPSGY